jgi:hypothetical protein
MKTMMKVFILVTFLFAFASCDNQGSFEPNNLISVADDTAAEEELATQTGPPFIKSFSITADQIFDAGDIITFNATFSKRTKIINAGTPRLVLTIGGVTRYANYVSGSESRDFIFVFQYTVQAGDLDHDGIELSDEVDLNGSVVQDYSAQDLNPSFTAPSLTGRKVDTANLSFTFAEGAITTTDSVNLNIVSAVFPELYVGEACLGSGADVVFANPLSYTLPNLNQLDTIYLAASNGLGGYSACHSVSITHDNLAPNNITGIINGNDSSDIVSDTATWNASTDRGPTGINYYSLAVSTTVNEADIVPGGEWKNVGTNTMGFIDNGSTSFLTGGVDYYTLIKAIDNAGNETSVFASPVWQVVALSPEQILSMSVTDSSDISLSVGWPYPDDKGFPITDYIINYKLAGSPTWITINDGVSTSRRHTLEGLDPETQYNFRVRAFNGTNFGAWSPTLTAETLPTIDFITTPYMAINVGGATLNQLVSFEDDNEIFYGNNPSSVFNDGSVISADLDKGKTISVPADDFTVVRGTKPFFIAGRLGSGADTSKANVVWQTSSWIGKEFLFSHSRSNPMKVKVFAFSDSDITITSNGGAVAGGFVSLLKDTGHTFTISTYGSYEISSTGFIMVYGYANGNGSQYVDPKPFLPSSNDLVGIPSRDAKVSSRTSGNNYVAYHSGNTTNSGVINAGATTNIDSRGTQGLYQDQSIRIRADEAIVANSYADADGSCSAPLVPVAFQKTRFALNVQSEWVAFASTNELTITATEPTADGLGFEAPRTYTLTRVGGNNNTPTKGYETARNFRAGTIFEGDAPFQMWYEPLNDTNGADNDETIMFGWD